MSSTPPNQQLLINPKSHSDSLLKLLDSGKKMCLAPLFAAGMLGVTQLSQGAYVKALETVGTGALITLVLIGTVVLSDLLVRRLASQGGPSSCEESKREKGLNQPLALL